MGAFFNFAGIIAAIAAISIAYVVVPAGGWDAAGIVSVISFASAIALILSAPKFLLGYGKTRTGTIASVGINGIVLTVYLILSFLSFMMVVIGIERTYIWVASILAISLMSAGLLISRGSISYLDSGFPDKKIDNFNEEALGYIGRIFANSNLDCQEEIRGLEDVIRFSASAMPGIADNEEREIISLIGGDLDEAVGTNNVNEIKNICSLIKQKFIQRDIKIKSSRPRA